MIVKSGPRHLRKRIVGAVSVKTLTWKRGFQADNTEATEHIFLEIKKWGRLSSRSANYWICSDYAEKFRMLFAEIDRSYFSGNRKKNYARGEENSFIHSVCSVVFCMHSNKISLF